MWRGCPWRPILIYCCKGTSRQQGFTPGSQCSRTQHGRDRGGCCSTLRCGAGREGECGPLLGTGSCSVHRQTTQVLWSLSTPPVGCAGNCCLSLSLFGCTALPSSAISSINTNYNWLSVSILVLGSIFWVSIDFNCMLLQMSSVLKKSKLKWWETYVWSSFITHHDDVSQHYTVKFNRSAMFSSA